MDKKERLVFNLIFGSKTEFFIDLGDYVVDIYFYDHFVDEVKDILRRARVMVVKSSIKVDSKTAMWELRVKK